MINSVSNGSRQYIVDENTITISGCDETVQYSYIAATQVRDMLRLIANLLYQFMAHGSRG